MEEEGAEGDVAEVETRREACRRLVVVTPVTHEGIMETTGATRVSSFVLFHLGVGHYTTKTL